MSFWKGFSMPPSPRQWRRAHTHTLAANISQHLFGATMSMNFATLRTLRPSNACIDVCAFSATSNYDGIVLTSFILGMISSCLLHGHCNNMYIEFELDPSAALVSNNSYCIHLYPICQQLAHKQRKANTHTYTRSILSSVFLLVFILPTHFKAWTTAAFSHTLYTYCVSKQS